MPAVMIAVMIVHSDGARLSVACGLRPAAMLRGRYRKRGKQNQQHSGY